jgi:hypothetical protein
MLADGRLLAVLGRRLLHLAGGVLGKEDDAVLVLGRIIKEGAGRVAVAAYVGR